MADTPAAMAPRRPVDFWLFWAGQAISALGSSLTAFALPLLVFKLTGSAINLALSMAASMLPYLCFGLILRVHLPGADAGPLAAAHTGQVLLGQELRIGQPVLQLFALQRPLGRATEPEE